MALEDRLTDDIIAIQKDIAEIRELREQADRAKRQLRRLISVQNALAWFDKTYRPSVNEMPDDVREIVEARRELENALSPYPHAHGD